MRISLDKLMQAIEDDDGVGFCLACGEETYGVEPDARHYACDTCDQREVFGAEEILIMGAYAEEE